MCTADSLYWEWNLQRLDNCVIHPKAVLNKPYSLRTVRVGKGTAIGPNSRMGETTIGRFCSIGPNFVCSWGVHPIEGISTAPAFYSTASQAGFTFSKENKVKEHKATIIGNDVFIGANVTVIDGVTIGDGAVIGAGAVVSKDIPPYAIAVGSPIKIIKYRFDNEIITRLLQIQWWNKGEEVLSLVEKHFFDIDAFIDAMDQTRDEKLSPKLEVTL
jgi:acetyltransferase-like isoleucine patch superfamily enzyme